MIKPRCYAADYRGAICNLLCKMADDYKAEGKTEAQKAIQKALTKIHAFNFENLDVDDEEDD